MVHLEEEEEEEGEDIPISDDDVISHLGTPKMSIDRDRDVPLNRERNFNLIRSIVNIMSTDGWPMHFVSSSIGVKRFGLSFCP